MLEIIEERHKESVACLLRRINISSNALYVVSLPCAIPLSWDSVIFFPASSSKNLT